MSVDISSVSRFTAHVVLHLAYRTLEFFAYNLSLVDRVARLPRNTMLPEAARLYRQNIALKAQLDALVLHVDRLENKRRAKPLSVRAAQVFALLLTRGTSRSCGTSCRHPARRSNGGSIASAGSGVVRRAADRVRMSTSKSSSFRSRKKIRPGAS